MRGAGGLESETERAQKALLEAKQSLAAEREEMSKLRAQVASEKATLAKLIELGEQARAEANAALEGGGGGGGAVSTAAAAALAELDSEVGRVGGDSAEGAAHSDARLEESNAALRLSESRAAQLEEEKAKELAMVREAMLDEHTIALEDAEEARVVSVAVLGDELAAAESALVEVERERRDLAEAAAASGSGESAALGKANAASAALQERVAALEGAAEENEKELREARAQLASAAEQRESLEQALKDAADAVRSAGGGAQELLDARREIQRLKKLGASAEAMEALQEAQKEELVRTATAAGRAEAEAGMEEAVKARVGEMSAVLKRQEQQLELIQKEVGVADEGRRLAEEAIHEAVQQAEETWEWSQDTVAKHTSAVEDRYAAAMTAKEAAEMGERDALYQLSLAERRAKECLQAADEAAQRVQPLEQELAAALEQVAALGEKLKRGGGGGGGGGSSFGSTRKPPPTQSVLATASAIDENEIPVPRAAKPSSPSAGDLAGTADLRDEPEEEAPRPPPPPAMSEEAMLGLMDRTQRQLVEVAALTEFERQILLGDSSHSAGDGSTSIVDATAAGVGVGGGGSGGGSLGGGKVVAGSASRIAWLLREGIGSTSSMGIKGAVRPSSKPMDNTQLRRVLRSLFGQQRALASQSAVGNWELLGAMVLLRPKQLSLQAVHDAIVSEVNSTTSDERRALLSSQQLPRVAALSAQREQQRRWCCQVWDLRRQAVGAVATRLSSQTLYALTKLTDAANTRPNAAAALSPLSSREPSKAGKKRDALASALFGAPPLLPFVLPPHAGTMSAFAHPAEDWGEWSTSQHTGGGAGQSAHDLWGRGNGLTTEQMQRLVIAAQHWPQDFVALGARLQRQVLAEAVAYCITGSMQPMQPGVPAATTRTPRPPPEGKSPRSAAVVASATSLIGSGEQPPSRPGTAPNPKPPVGEGGAGWTTRASGRQAGAAVVLAPRKADGTPALPSSRVLFSR